MKSLDIVNKNIKAIKKLLYNLKDVQEGTREDFDMYYHEQELKEQQQIKQDLEVLEIIYKKKIVIEHIKTKLECWENLEALLEFWNSLTSHKDSQLTLEELLKLKQWLEENENDR